MAATRSGSLWRELTNTPEFCARAGSVGQSRNVRCRSPSAPIAHRLGCLGRFSLRSTCYLEITAQIAPNGQTRIGPKGIGKKTALAILAATRMPAVTTVKVSNLRIAFSSLCRVLVGNSAANTFRPNSSIGASRSLRLHFLVHRETPFMCLVAWSGVSSMDDCLNAGAAGATHDS